MPRYIDADELYKKIFPLDVVDKRRYSINAKAVAEAIAGMPTADVAPRAEAVREVFKAFGVLIPENTTLEEAVESYKKTQKIIRNMAIANAKAEVAREIFEEIEKTVNACVVDESLFKPAYFEFRKFNEQLAELKKKYTGDQEDGTDHARND